MMYSHLFRKKIFFLCVCLLFLSMLYKEAGATSIIQLDALQWPRMKADAFGCFIERTLGYRDSKFNCELKNYMNHGDPCRNTIEYYEGPSFPRDKLTNVHPTIEGMELFWEHGMLQRIEIVFRQQVSEEMARKMILLLPDKKNHPMPNVRSFQFYTQPVTGQVSLSIVGFEHVGSGEVDCD